MKHLTIEQRDETRAEAKIVCRWLDEYESSFPPEHISTWAVGHIRGWVSLQGDNPILNANTEESKEEADKSFLLSLKHREITLMNYRLDSLKNEPDKIEEIDRLLESLRENIKEKEQPKQESN